MNELSDALLTEAYEKAIELQLDNAFIKIIEDELTKRDCLKIEYS